MRTTLRIRCLIVVLALVAVAPGFALERAVTSDGTIHTVEKIAWGHGPEGDGGTKGGAALRHVVRRPDGTQETHILPGTDDFTLDREPSLDLDPDAGAVVVAWSRVVRRGGHEILLARFAQGAWTEPQVVYAGDTRDSNPQIRFARDHLHVMWEQDIDGADPRRLRVALDRSTLGPVYGPVDMPLSGPPIGFDTGNPPPPTDDLTYFASLVPPAIPGDGATIVVWGIRDEPVPITYLRTIAVPPGVESAQQVEAEWLAGHLVTWFVSGSRFYHARRIDMDGNWTDVQRIDMDGDLVAAEARMMIESMLRREDLDVP